MSYTLYILIEGADAMPSLPNDGDPVGEQFPQGPEMGERIPEFSLPDQKNQTIHFKPAGQSKKLILFHRSAAW